MRGSSKEQTEEGNSTVGAGRYLEQVSTLWEDADLGQRRELLHAILETVKVDVWAHRVICENLGRSLYRDSGKWKNWRKKKMGVSTSAKLPPAVGRFLKLYAEIAREVAKRKAGAHKS